MQSPMTRSKAIRGADLLGDTLTVFFQDGGMAVYLGVEELVYAELLSAASPGRYYVANIRGCYERKAPR